MEPQYEGTCVLRYIFTQYYTNVLTLLKTDPPIYYVSPCRFRTYSQKIQGIL
jgi:hypothetical protein